MIFLKRHNVRGLIEAFILYLLLFLQGIFPVNDFPSAIVFSPSGALLRFFIYTVPALVLLSYLLFYKKNKEGEKATLNLPRFALKDVRVFALCFTGLVFTGFIISFAADFFTPSPNPAKITMPPDFFAYFVMIVSAMSIGYLEEIFFRVYLIKRIRDAGVGLMRSVLLSSVMFALCHIYAGQWSVLNAAVAGLGLAFVYTRYLSVHGIALAHGVYNIFVHIAGQFF